MIFTDEWMPYVGIERYFKGHRRIHHRSGVYVEGDNYTNTVEGFFGLFKTGVRGVYHSISQRYLQNYLDEYAFRYNRREGREPMFWAILNRVQKAIPASS
jgi:transposase